MSLATAAEIDNRILRLISMGDMERPRGIHEQGSQGKDEVESARVIGNGAVVVSRSGFRMPGEETVAPERLRRATWTLARHDSGWLIEAYHNCAV